MPALIDTQDEDGILDVIVPVVDNVNKPRADQATQYRPHRRAIDGVLMDTVLSALVDGPQDDGGNAERREESMPGDEKRADLKDIGIDPDVYRGENVQVEIPRCL